MSRQRDGGGKEREKLHFLDERFKRIPLNSTGRIEKFLKVFSIANLPRLNLLRSRNVFTLDTDMRVKMTGKSDCCASCDRRVFLLARCDPDLPNPATFDSPRALLRTNERGPAHITREISIFPRRSLLSLNPKSLAPPKSINSCSSNIRFYFTKTILNFLSIFSM